jgi:hypothetical protein
VSGLHDRAPERGSGGFKDSTLYSMELAQDAYVRGGLPGMLAESAARKFALAVDASGIVGITGLPATRPLQ